MDVGLYLLTPQSAAINNNLFEHNFDGNMHQIHEKVHGFWTKSAEQFGMEATQYSSIQNFIFVWSWLSSRRAESQPVSTSTKKGDIFGTIYVIWRKRRRLIDANWECASHKKASSEEGRERASISHE